MHFLNEVAKHLLGDVEVADHSVTKRTDRDDRGGSAPHHALGLGTDRQHRARARVFRDDGRLADDDPAPTDVDEGVCRAQIYTDIARDQAEYRIEQSQEPLRVLCVLAPNCNARNGALARCRRLSWCRSGSSCDPKGQFGCRSRGRLGYRLRRRPRCAWRGGAFRLRSAEEMRATPSPEAASWHCTATSASPPTAPTSRCRSPVSASRCP